MKNLNQCTSLQEQAADCLPIKSLDTRQLSLLNGSLMHVKSSENEPQKDGSQVCTCGKETLDCLIHPSTPESWTSYMRDSLALILALPENKLALAKIREVDSIEKPSGLLGCYDQSTSTWKTSQQSFLTESELCLETWPRSGMTVNGCVYELPIAAHRMKEIDGGFLATPTTVSNQLAPSMMKHKSCRAMAAKVYPTPTAHDAKKGNYPSEHNRNTPGIAVILGGKPAPTFQEWQMGWPINHTALRQSEMGKSRCKPQLHGSYSEGHE